MLDTPVNSLKHALRAGRCRSTLTAGRAAPADVANHRGIEGTERLDSTALAGVAGVFSLCVSVPLW